MRVSEGGVRVSEGDGGGVRVMEGWRDGGKGE